ncbi:MAG: peptide-methionine (S)-S-oxide reductase MsrA [Parvibaculum sp.]|nr:peptide-methionine (S)-S-oxide reductase MsrA [Parvibaculum sp.]
MFPSLTTLLRGALIATAIMTAGAASAAEAATDAAVTPLPVATFAGGCFWSMQRHFDDVAGVTATRVGYSGGPEKNPSYNQVASEVTGHAEVVEVTYDPAKTTYEKLLTSYWHYIDPTTVDGQFCDFGHSYRTAIFTHGEAQANAAEASKAAIEKSGVLKGKPVVTAIEAAGPFWPAETYHQEFYKKNPVRYTSYRIGCGRDAALKRIWGDKAGS